MAPISSSDMVIVRTESGEATGDVLHQTADGRWWRELPQWESNTTPATGIERGTIRGGKIHPKFGG